jgi:uncharacterized membrane protein YkoI
MLGKYSLRIFIMTMVMIMITLPLSAMPVYGMQLAANERVTLEQAVARVKQQTGGRILTAETQSHDNQPVHRIKVLLPDGRIRVITIDAR